MIKLTRLDGREILLNEDYIEIVEETPDTVVTFQNTHRLIVKENIDEILEKIREYKKASRK